MSNPLEDLPLKQRLFVEAYFACDYNASEACVKAGYNTKYPNKYGYELLNKPKVKAAIDFLAKKRIDAVTVKPDYVLRKVVKIVEQADIDNNPTAALRGLEMLARHLGMFVERQEITGADGEAIKYEKVSQDAASFTRSIVSLAKRGRANDDSEGDDAREAG